MIHHKSNFKTQKKKKTKECITWTIATTKNQDEQKVDHGKVKTKEDIDFKLKSLPSIHFIIPNEFTNMARKKDSLILMLTKSYLWMLKASTLVELFF